MTKSISPLLCIAMDMYVQVTILMSADYVFVCEPFLRSWLHNDMLD